MSESTTVHNVTDVLTPKSATRKKMEKALVVVAVATSAVLLVNSQLKRLARNKNIAVVVEDKPDN